MVITTPYIPEYITVHLGPPDSYAENVTVSFPNYIKNVASSEIYPTWSESAIRANILAQISFALNRVYLEFYPSRGYNFNITNSTAYDQNFENGRNIFENISRIVDDIFTSYIRREGFIEPLAAKFCNGTTVTCDGLSQWGSEYLAREGYLPYQILENYYGEDIEIVENAPIQGIRNSYPGTPLRVGDRGDDVVVIQSSLNRISQDYPSIPKINPVDGIFGTQTENAVKKFQEIFDLTPDGIVGKATWNKLVLLYVGVSDLAELESEGVRLFGQSLQYPGPMVEGSRLLIRSLQCPSSIEEGTKSEKVAILQYFLSVIAQFNDNIPFLQITGEFGPETKNAVIAFQQLNNLPQTGVVNATTWDAIYNSFKGIIDTVFLSGKTNTIQAEPFGGVALELGSTGESVKTLQQYLNAISNVYSSINPIPVTGEFGPETEEAVKQYQRQFSFPETGVVDRNVWNSIANEYKTVISTTTTRPTQFPGYNLKLGTQD